jgi:hypothetical protein
VASRLIQQDAIEMFNRRWFQLEQFHRCLHGFAD